MDPSQNVVLKRPNSLIELALVLPIFLLYHFGVIFLNVQNSTDFLTSIFLDISHGSMIHYLGLTSSIGLGIGSIFYLLGRGKVFEKSKFFQIAIEGFIYALLMRLIASYLVTRLPLVPIEKGILDRFQGLILSSGAGFYEELAFRVILFGFGSKILLWFFTHDKISLTSEKIQKKISWRGLSILLFWSFVSSLIFSGIHYVGVFSDTFTFRSFIFRTLLGLSLTSIYWFRGFAASVWTHTIYDIWVLVF